MRRLPRGPVVLVSLVAAGLLAPLALPAVRSAWARLRPAARGPAVLVIVVGDPGTLAAIRAGVAPERVVAASDEAFAVREDRVVAVSVEAAGPVLTAAGLAGRRIEIWSASAVRAPDPFRPGPRTAGAAQKLASKPTLTLGEALMLLDQDLR
jgi:hypothetical protein